MGIELRLEIKLILGVNFRKIGKRKYRIRNFLFIYGFCFLYCFRIRFKSYFKNLWIENSNLLKRKRKRIIDFGSRVFCFFSNKFKGLKDRNLVREGILFLE